MSIEDMEAAETLNNLSQSKGRQRMRLDVELTCGIRIPFPQTVPSAAAYTRANAYQF
jgi:hypothetical protein